MKIPNNKARPFVQSCVDFKGSNTFGEWAGRQFYGGYVVYSYGRHWPMFIKHGDIWFENQDKYSRTTSKHHGQLHPHAPTIKKSAMEMLMLRDGIESGALQWTCETVKS